MYNDDLPTDDMQAVLQQKMKDKVLAIRQDDNYVDSLLRITAYKQHNRLILDEFRQRIQILDETYNKYRFHNDIAQISIIFFSTISTFVQTFFCEELDPYEVFALIVTLYTSFVLSLVKYKKLEERKESVNNIRHQCAEFLTSIQTRNDKLNTWCYDKMWAGGNIDILLEQWKETDSLLYNGLSDIIEKKQELTCEFEKIMDTKTTKRILQNIRESDVKYKKRSIEITQQEDNIDSETTRLEIKKKKYDNVVFYQGNHESPERPMIGTRGRNETSHRNKRTNEVYHFRYGENDN